MTSPRRGLDKLDRGVVKAERRLRAASRVAFGFGAALSTALVGSLAAFSRVEAKISEVAGKTGLAAKVIREEYAGALREIGQRTGQVDADLFDGLQKALSAGLEGADAIEAVDVAAQAAAAGIGGIGDQVSAATTLVTIFGGTARDALDTIARAAQVGEGETADFAAALKGVAGFAEQIGLTAHGTAAGLAAVSQVAASVPEGMTQFRSFLQSLLSPSEQAQKEIAGLHDSFANLRDLARREGLGAVLARVRELGGGDPERLARLLGRTEAEAFALTVDSSALAGLEAEIATTFRGSIAAAFGEGENDLRRNVAKLRETFRDLLEDFGAEAAPVALEVVRAVHGVVKALAALPTPFKHAIAGAMLFGPVLIGLSGALRLAAAGVAPLYSGLLNLYTMPQGPVVGLTGKVKGLGRAAGGVGRTLLTLARTTWVGALVGGLILLALHWDKVQSAIRRAWSAVQDYFSAEGRQRREVGKAVDVQADLVDILEEQLRVMQEQGAPMSDQLELARRVKEERAEELRLQQALAALEEKRARQVARDVTLPALLAERRALLADTERVEERLERGGRLSARGSLVEDSDADRLALEAQLARLRGEGRRNTAQRAATYRIVTGEGVQSFPASMLPGRPGREGEDGGSTVAEILGTPDGGAPDSVDTGAPASTEQVRTPAPERIEVRNMDVVDAITRQRAALVRELRTLGVLIRGGELPARLATRDVGRAVPDAPKVEVPEVEVPALAAPVLEPPEAPMLAVPEVPALAAPEVPPIAPVPTPADVLLAEAVAQWEADRGLAVPEWPDAPGVDVTLPPQEPVPLPQAIVTPVDAPTGAPTPADAPTAAPVAPNPFQAMDAHTAATLAGQQADYSTTTSTTNNRRTVNLGGVHIGEIQVTAAEGQSPEDVAEAVTDRVESVFRDQLSELLEDSDAGFTR